MAGDLALSFGSCSSPALDAPQPRFGGLVILMLVVYTTKPFCRTVELCPPEGPGSAALLDEAPRGARLAQAAPEPPRGKLLGALGGSGTAVPQMGSPLRPAPFLRPSWLLPGTPWALRNIHTFRLGPKSRLAPSPHVRSLVRIFRGSASRDSKMTDPARLSSCWGFFRDSWE